MQIYRVLITDQANFGKTEFEGYFADENLARRESEKVVRDLVERDRHHGLGDTFHVEIRKIQVRRN